MEHEHFEEVRPEELDQLSAAAQEQHAVPEWLEEQVEVEVRAMTNGVRGEAALAVAGAVRNSRYRQFAARRESVRLLAENGLFNPRFARDPEFGQPYERVQERPAPLPPPKPELVQRAQEKFSPKPEAHDGT